MILKIISLLLPWKLRRLALNKWFGYKIHADAKIGFSWIFPEKLIMKPGARIGHFTVAINLATIELESNATIERGNWITGFPKNTATKHFTHQPERDPRLYVGESSSITKNHHLDCTSLISIGRFSTIAGYNSQFLTHSLDVIENRQDSNAIYIGDFTFVGTNVVVLGGARLPSYCILGAKSLLNKSYIKEWTLYGGIPAREINEIPKTAKYFSRKEGFVY